jgi:uroporphyrinogen decarboxylase
MELAMNSRERIRTIISGGKPDKCGFWLGNPHPDTWKILFKHFETENEEEIRLKLKDDFRWLSPWDVYKHPDNKPIFDIQRAGKTLSEGGILANCESVEEVEAFDWPNPDYLELEPFVEELKSVGDYYRASGFWSSFFHDVCDFFGMENYFLKMYLNPAVVHAVTKHIVDFYLEANKRLFELAGNEIDGFFFGNDFGSQLDILITPDQFKEFVFPYFRQLTQLGHEYNYQVILHSCGAIHRVIPDLIDMKVDAIHPIQAKAANMNAEKLKTDFSGKVNFIGGIDTQALLVNATPTEVKEDIKRVKNFLLQVSLSAQVMKRFCQMYLLKISSQWLRKLLKKIEV